MFFYFLAAVCVCVSLYVHVCVFFVSMCACVLILLLLLPVPVSHYPPASLPLPTWAGHHGDRAPQKAPAVDSVAVQVVADEGSPAVLAPGHAH